MSQTLIDLYNNVLEYGKTKITVILDNKDMIWFSAPEVTKFLEYANTSQAVSDHVLKNDKTTLSKLQKFMKVIPPNSRPNTIFINEPGLYSLTLASNMPKAEKFRIWITHKVLPSIRKHGKYEMRDPVKIQKLHDKIKELQSHRKVYRRDRQNIQFPKGGSIYAAETEIRTSDGKRLIKIGMTENMRSRVSTLETSLPNKLNILYVLKVKDPKAVEHCVKALLIKYIYRSKKEYYICPLKKIKDAMDKCAFFVENGYYCDTCVNNYPMKRIANDTDITEDNTEKRLYRIHFSTDTNTENTDGDDKKELLYIHISSDGDVEGIDDDDDDDDEDDDEEDYIEDLNVYAPPTEAEYYHMKYVNCRIRYLRLKIKYLSH